MSKELLGSLELNRIYQMDCLEGMKLIPDGSIDMILCDLPYGTTQCKWDTIIPFEPLWTQYERIIKDEGAIILTASQPFTSKLVNSNIKLFKYDAVWIKTKVGGFAQAPYKMMNKKEDILVFSKAGCAKNAVPRMKYYPQGLIYAPKIVKGKKANASEHRIRKTDQKDFMSEYTNYPNNILSFDSEFKTIHPTQKPVALFEYLIKTFSDENNIILDNCIGSGTTAVACTLNNRKWIGFETEPKYIELANKRLEQINLEADLNKY